jgi:hypothetical protein
MLQHLDAVESVQIVLGLAVFKPAMVVARVSWILVQVVDVRSGCGGWLICLAEVRIMAYSSSLHGRPEESSRVLLNWERAVAHTMNLKRFKNVSQ